MLADPSIVDAAASASEALAEFGRKVAAMPAAPATDDLAAELRRLADASARRWAEVRDELGSLRRAVERLAERQGLVDPVVEINRQARAEMASAPAEAPRAPRVKKQRANASALTPERRARLEELWALPSAEMSGGAIRVHLDKMPGGELDRNAVYRWAHALKLPYRRKRAGDDAGDLRRAPASHTQLAGDDSVGAVAEDDVAADPAAEVTAPVAVAATDGNVPPVVPGQDAAPAARVPEPSPVPPDPAPPPAVSAATDPRNWPRPPDRIVAPGREGAVPAEVPADDATVRAWAGVRGIVFQGQIDLARVNAARQTHGQAPFRLIDRRGEVVR